MAICDIQKVDNYFQGHTSSYEDPDLCVRPVSTEGYELTLPWDKKIYGCKLRDFRQRPLYLPVVGRLCAGIEMTEVEPATANIIEVTPSFFKMGSASDFEYEHISRALKFDECLYAEQDNTLRDSALDALLVYALPASPVKGTVLGQSEMHTEDDLLDRRRALMRLSRTGTLSESERDELALLEERLDVLDRNDTAVAAANAKLDEHIDKLRTIAQIRTLLQTF